MKIQWIIHYFLRFSLAIGFLSAVADRLGFWPTEMAAWGTWDNFIAYTGILNPWFPNSIIDFVALVVTILEVVLALLLLLGYKTQWAAKTSGFLLLVFALAMIFTTGIKGPLDYSVFTAAAAAFALDILTEPSFTTLK